MSGPNPTGIKMTRKAFRFTPKCCCGETCCCDELQLTVSGAADACNPGAFETTGYSALDGTYLIQQADDCDGGTELPICSTASFLYACCFSSTEFDIDLTTLGATITQTFRWHLTRCNEENPKWWLWLEWLPVGIIPQRAVFQKIGEVDPTCDDFKDGFDLEFVVGFCEDVFTTATISLECHATP